MSDLGVEDFLVQEAVVQLGIPPVRIDLLTSIDGVSNEEVFASKLTDTLDDGTIHFIGYDQLLANKRAANRPKDLADVAELESED